ncbi:unnamed protein product, partial [Medioppia subpectinata]
MYWRGGVSCGPIAATIASTDRSFKDSIGRMSRLFYTYGKVCASHPCEVMVAFFSLLFISMFSMGSQVLHNQPNTYSSGHCLKNSECFEAIDYLVNNCSKSTFKFIIVCRVDNLCIVKLML